MVGSKVTRRKETPMIGNVLLYLVRAGSIVRAAERLANSSPRLFVR